MSTEKNLKFTNEELGFLYSSVLLRINECERMIKSLENFGDIDDNLAYWKLQLQKAKVLRTKLIRL